MVIATLCLNLFAQNSRTELLKSQNPETYIETLAKSKTEINMLGKQFSIDKVTHNTDNSYTVRLCIPSKHYADFVALNRPFKIMPTHKASVTMATSYAQMTSAWNRYPTYSTYLAMMDTFQTQFPNICKIDTILSQTPGNHALLVAHISNNLSERGNKPAFFYTSSMHGDEVVGYYYMLHLIHYLLNNYTSNTQVQNIINNVDLWICPLENPDGTYHTSNNNLNESPYSTRENYNGEDLNRSYPLIGSTAKPSPLTYQPEVQAMINFGTTHKLTMSANFHGGAELYNYPWDLWTSYERAPADDAWWSYIGNRFVDTCQHYHSSYMTEGVFEGADWYTAEGSRQDYFTYYLGSREVTIEICDDKVLASSQLPTYWNYINHSLLNYIEESLYGIRGIVTDSITSQPIEATVVINNHDADNSQTHSILPTGNYHRPIKGGTWSVTYSASGYYSKTYSLAVTDHNTTVQDVALVPLGYGVEDITKGDIRIYPSPAQNVLNIDIHHLDIRNLTAGIYSIDGKLLFTQTLSSENTTLNISNLVSGLYVAKVFQNGNTVYNRKIVINR